MGHGGGIRRTALAAVVVALLLTGLTGCGGKRWKGSGLAGPFQPRPGAAYVIDGSDRVEVDGIVRLLRALGRPTEVVDDIDATKTQGSLVWVPESARNDAKRAERLFGALNGGTRLVLAGPSELATKIGLRFGPDKVRITGERYAASPDLEVVWNLPRTTLAMHDTRKDYVAATTPDGKHPLAVSGSVGGGPFLWMAVGAGTAAAERFPLLPLMLRDLLNEPASVVFRQGIDLYVDPGSVAGIDPNQLADRWMSEGVRTVYISAWEFGFDRGNADYDAFIAAAHSHGMSAYAWLAPPVVNDVTYDRHPECREKTATGADAVGDWRRLLALEDPSCMQLAIDAYREVLSAHQWDGANVAELYFEGPLSGADKPEIFTPMSAWVRQDFAATHGFDPAELFDKSSPHYRTKSKSSLKAFLDYRTDLVEQLHRTVISALPAGLDVVVTTIDDKLAPSTARNVGVDVSRLQRMGEELHFRLQYEDPFTVWTQGPRRYDAIHGLYPVGSVFDVNAVPRPGGKPTSTPTGSELLVTAAAAAGDTGEVALYAEGTVAPLDVAWLPGAISAAAKVEIRDGASGAPPVTGTVIDVDSPFAVRITGPDHARSAQVDGAPWPLMDGNQILLTRGTHNVVFSDEPATHVAVRACSCEFTAARADGISTYAYYVSATPGWLLVRDAPAKAKVDGVPIPLVKVSGGYMLRLPPGEHTLDVA